MRTPLQFGARTTFREMRQDRVAMDRSPSSRTVNADGHMRVLGSAVSKANVCEYLGAEIPGAAELGLRPDGIYRLYRDPAELKRASDTLNGRPLMTVHRPQSASDHDTSVVIGALDGAVWDPPYLRANLTIWSEDGIGLVCSGQQRQLSAGYRYTPVLKAGVAPDGSPYDLVMTNLQFNHVSLVEAGRAGPDCMVGDSKPKSKPRRLPMANDDNDDTRMKLLNFLAGKLDGDALLQAIKIIDGTDDDDDDEEATGQAADAKMKKLAADKARRSAMFPHSGRLR